MTETYHTPRDKERGLIYSTLSVGGKFAFAGLEPGTYLLHASHFDRKSGSSWNADAHYPTPKEGLPQKLDVQVRRVD
ncbi:MAG: hypothetical protein ACI8X5_002151 [Planctomycetota bacterium]|jgi:hypothetical protein